MLILPTVAWHHYDRLNSTLDININVVVQLIMHHCQASTDGCCGWRDPLPVGLLALMLLIEDSS